MGLDRLKGKKAWVGLDGFLDHIVSAVKLRHGPGAQFEPYATLAEFGQKIQAASGANLNLEFFPKLEKMGGNGPLLANALAQIGVQVYYTGLLGDPIHPAFKTFAQRTHAQTLGAYGETTAVEFQDGKLILGKTYPLEALTYERWIATVPESVLIETYSNMDLISFQNWTMTLHMSAILEKILERIWPHISKRERLLFFDLADPSKRSPEDIQRLFTLLPQFRSKARVYLALNQAELKHIAYLYQHHGLEEAWNFEAFFHGLQSLKTQLQIDGLIVHSHQGAVAACEEQVAFAPSQKARTLTCLTGSGDHFNGGFLCGCLMHFPLEKCLALGHSVAVSYIETGESPTSDTLRPVCEHLKGEEL